MTAHVAYDRQESGMGLAGWMYHDDDRSVWDYPANKLLEPKYPRARDAYRSGCQPIVDLTSPVETLHGLPTERYLAPTLQSVSAATGPSSRKRKIFSDEPFVSAAQKIHLPLDSTTTGMSSSSSFSFSQPTILLQAPSRSYNHFPPLIQSLPAHPILSLTELSSVLTPKVTQFNTQTTQSSLHPLAASQIVAEIMVELAKRDNKRVRCTSDHHDNEQRGNEQRSDGLHGNGQQRYSVQRASSQRVAGQRVSMQHDIAQMIKPTRRLLNLLEAATKHMPDPDYHTNIQGWRGRVGTREELVSWMYEINRQFNFSFQPDTLYRAINYLDRFLSRRRVWWRTRLFDYALACFYVAAKFGEENREPTAKDMARCSEHPIASGRVKKLERELLATLDWEVHIVTPQDIMHELICSLPNTTNPKYHRQCTNLMSVAQDFLDVVCQEWDYVRNPPSVLAVASMCCALEFLNFIDKDESKRVIIKLASVNEIALNGCIRLMKTAMSTITPKAAGMQYP